MLTELVESRPQHDSLKRRGSFFIITLAAYTFIIMLAGVASIYAYDVHLDAENREHVEMLIFPPLAPDPEVRPQPRTTLAAHTPAATLPITRIATRTDTITSTADPMNPPMTTSTARVTVPSIPLNGTFKIGDTNTGGVPLIPSGVGDPNSDRTATGGDGIGNKRSQIPPPLPPVKLAATAPKLTPEKPAAPRRVSDGVLKGMALDLPQPSYDRTARSLRISDTIAVQIVIDKQGRVTSAHAVGGHALLRASAVRAALRARFKPTLLSGEPVSVQGIINYRFKLEG